MITSDTLCSGSYWNPSTDVMHLLILGGTVFLGRHLVDAARARGHAVTLFNRGTRPLPWSDVEQLVGDRDGGLDALDGRRWDAAIDTCGFVPRVVGASATRLADAVEHYTFVSSVSVYRDFSHRGIAEDAPLSTIGDPATEDVAAHYGALKALTEQAAEQALPGRCLHVRAGLIVGPFDETGRFGYWVRRVAAGGEVLAPGRPERPIQFIDVRDLAAWIVAMAEARRPGTFNAAGPGHRTTMSDLLTACRRDGSEESPTPRFTWVDDAFLVERAVQPFTNLPLWLPPELNGLLEVDVSRATAAGLRCRPVEATVADTAAWLATAPASSSPPTRASVMAQHAGLSAERERALLADWATAVRSVVPSRAGAP